MELPDFAEPSLGNVQIQFRSPRRLREIWGDESREPHIKFVFAPGEELDYMLIIFPSTGHHAEQVDTADSYFHGGIYPDSREVYINFRDDELDAAFEEKVIEFFVGMLGQFENGDEA